MHSRVLNACKNPPGGDPFAPFHRRAFSDSQARSQCQLVLRSGSGRCCEYDIRAISIITGDHFSGMYSEFITQSAHIESVVGELRFFRVQQYCSCEFLRGCDEGSSL